MLRLLMMTWVLLAAMALPAWAQIADSATPAEAAASEAGANGWRFEGTTWIWAMGLSGDLGVRGQKTQVDESFIDLLDATDSVLGLSGRLEIGMGKIAGFVDGTWSRLGVEDQSGPAGLNKVDVTLNMGLVDFGLMYRLGEWQSSTAGQRNATLDVYGGARYVSIDLDFDFQGAADRSGSIAWIDPIVGLKGSVPLIGKWRVSAWGDVGGFGASSDFTWSATGVLGYDFHLFKLPATVYAGYRAVGTEHTEGSGNDKFVFDATLHGPILGLELRF